MKLTRLFSILIISPLLCAVSASASAPLIWDPLGNNGGGGSGNWDTVTTDWWNGSTDVAWSQISSTSPTQSNTFNGPDAAPGTYNVTNVGVAVSNIMQINNNGYAFWGSGIYIGTDCTLGVAAGKTVTFNCPLGGSGTSPFWVLGAGATLNAFGGLTGTQQTRFAGAAGSAFNLSGSISPAIMFILGTVNVTNGTMIPSSTIDLGYPNPNPINGVSYTSGTLNLSGASSSLTINGNLFIIGRSGGSGTFNLTNGTVTVGNSSASRNLAIDYDSSANSSGIVNVYGGSLTVGSSSQTGNVIDFFDTATAGAGTGATAVLNQTGGVINAVNGIVFGATSGSFAGGSAALTNAGGVLYVGSKGIALNTVYPPSIFIDLTGGTVAASANWSSSLPMTLDTPNGNTTFQCADSGGSPWNISLSGALTGTGGFYQTGGGTLSLSGANTIPGNIVVSNGTLAIVTGNAMTYGPITLDGSTGLPTLSARVSNLGQSFSTGALTFRSGAPTSDFQFGSITPSTTTAAIQVGGNVNFAVTPTVTVEGTALASGTYPLIQYTGALSGVSPGVATLPSYVSGYVTNISASKTIALVITNSTFNDFTWAVGNGTWDTSTENWKQLGIPTNYTDGDAVVFDDTASGASPITITLNTTVNPSSITANNKAKQYTISGTGSIAGAAALSLVGGGTFSLATANTYTGGTVLAAGQLNINNGGTATASAIGTGPLSISNGVAIDNTSSANVLLQTGNAQTWGGNFAYIGSAHNLNTGAGPISMISPVSIAVSNNNFIVGGSIADNGYGYSLTKTGPGALTLSNANFFTGGVTLTSGLLNLEDPNATGQGVFSIYGGSIDNTSGQPLQMVGPSSYTWGNSFTFVGSTNLDLNYMAITVPNGPGSITVNVASNTLSTEGAIVNNNTTVIKTGNGTWDISGGTASESLGLVVNAGEVILAKSGQAISGGNSFGLTVNSGGLVVDGNAYQIHSDSGVAIPVNLSGGIWDLNGFNENVDKLSISAGGTLRNSAPGATSTIGFPAGYVTQLSGTNCQFAVTDPAGVLNFNGVIGGVGALVKTGPGLLNLNTNNLYTGATIIDAGTLALPGISSITNSSGIDLAASSSILDVSQNTDTNGNPTPTLTLYSGQTLAGIGVVNGLLQSQAGSIVAPGSSSTIGTLTVSGVAGADSLGGITMMKLNKTAHTNDQLSVSGSLVYGGTLSLANVSGTLSAGDSFTLFNAAGGASGAFASITPSRPNFPGFGLAWNTANLDTTGAISVVAAAVPPPPAFTTVNLTGTTLTVSGTNGVANEPFVVLETSNLALPLSAWTPIATNAFNGSGNFSVSITVTNSPQEFYAVFVQ